MNQDKLTVNVWLWYPTQTQDRWTFVVAYGNRTFTGVYFKSIQQRVEQRSYSGKYSGLRTVDPTPAEILAAITNDAECYKSCCGDLISFLRVFGYINNDKNIIEDGVRAFEESRRAAIFIDGLPINIRQQLPEYNDD